MPRPVRRPSSPAAAAFATGRTVRVVDVTDGVLRAIAGDGSALLDTLRTIRPRDIVCIPLVAHGRPHGVVTVWRHTPDVVFAPADLDMLEELARRAALAIENARLYGAERTARAAAERAADRMARLQTLTTALSGALTPEQVAAGIATEGRLALGARGAVLRLLSADGTALRAVGASGEPGQLAANQLDLPLETLLPLPEAVRTRSLVTVETLAEIERRYPLVTTLPDRALNGAFVAVPLEIEGRVVGGLLLAFGQPRHFDEPDKALVRALAQLCAQALDRARLYAVEHQARAAAERDRRRGAFLSEASALLTASLDPMVALNSIARLVVPALVDSCAVSIVDGAGVLRRVVSVTRNGAMAEDTLAVLNRYTAGPPAGSPADEAFRTGRTVYYADEPKEVQETFAGGNAAYLAVLRQVEPMSTLCVPLVAHGRALGVATLTIGRGGPRLSDADVTMLEELAQAALAVENAGLYVAEQSARATAERAAERTARLQAVTSALADAITPEQACETISAQSVGLGAQTVIVMRVAADGDGLELLHISGYAPEAAATWERATRRDRTPLAEAVRTGRPVFVTSRAQLLAEYADAVPIPGQTSNHSFAALPLTVEGRVFGVLRLGFPQPRRFDAEDRAFLLALGRLCAQALERTRLHEAEREARAAIEADRLKTDLLNTVSHELRTPLSAIKGYTTTLMEFAGRIEREEQESFLGEVDRAADRLIGLVDNLLQIARLESNQLPMEPQPVVVASVLRSAVRQMSHRGVAIMLDVADDLPPVMADPGRLEQVVANLIDNAIKFSPEGASVAIHAHPAAGDAVAIEVSDRGPGIAPEHQARVFERFYRVESGLTRQAGGSGLGLAICKAIIEQHGGTITLASVEGAGSTFTVTLPAPAT
ncbi:MAG: GAF domain-containing protein [Dehalococcoidia bacterium]